jgi:hypothetical protein
MEEQNQEPMAPKQEEHKKKCGFCPLSAKCPMSGKPYVCAGAVVLIIVGISFLKG